MQSITNPCRALAFALIWSVCATAAADTTLVYDAGDSEFSVKIRPGEIRIDDVGGGWQLYRESENAVYSVDPANERYTRMDEQAAAKIKARMQALRDQMERELQQLPERQRSMAREMMANKIPGLGRGGEVRVQRMGSADSVAGRPCERAQALRDGEVRETLCVSPPDALGLAPEEFATVKAMFGLMETMLAGTGFEHIGLPYLDLEGMPVRYVDAESGESRVLKRVAHDELPDLAFEIPPSYERQAREGAPNGQ